MLCSRLLMKLVQPDQSIENFDQQDFVFLDNGPRDHFLKIANDFRCPSLFCRH